MKINILRTAIVVGVCFLIVVNLRLMGMANLRPECIARRSVQEDISDSSPEIWKQDTASQCPSCTCPPANEQCSASDVRSVHHETALRRTERTATAMWTFLDDSVKDVRTRALGHEALLNTVQRMHTTLQALRSTLAANLYALRGAEKDEEWQREESRELGSLVQQRLHKLQNPVNCSQARFAVCNLKLRNCGFGCLLHHVCYCLLIAYGSNRTLVLQEGSLLHAQNKWEAVFQPLSRTCNTVRGPVVRWGAKDKNWESARALFVPIYPQLDPKPDFLPMAIPEDLAPRLTLFHGDPPVWWIGQFLRYLTRPNKRLHDHIKSEAKILGFQRPIAGIHARRTDKVKGSQIEASFHSLEEYMGHVNNYFREVELYKPVAVRRVYLATDDPYLLKEAQKKYPDYVFVNNNNASRQAAPDTRYSDMALLGINSDIHFLSSCDFLVCTFSSNVGRAAYALMQTYNGDASTNVRSLDKRFYFNGQQDEYMQAVERHQKESKHQVSFETGDTLRVQGNALSGIMTRGVNLRTGESGMFPTYKAVKKIITARTPIYADLN